MQAIREALKQLKEDDAGTVATSCPKCGSNNIILLRTEESGDPTDYFGDDIEGDEFTTERHYKCNKCNCYYKDVVVQLSATGIIEKDEIKEQEKLNFIKDHLADKLEAWELYGFCNFADFCEFEGLINNQANYSKNINTYLNYIDKYAYNEVNTELPRAVNNWRRLLDKSNYYNDAYNKAISYNITKEDVERAVIEEWTERVNLWVEVAGDYGVDSKDRIKMNNIFNKYKLKF